MQHPHDGPVTVTAIPGQLSASPPSVRRLWPALGEHTEEVLREIGCDEREIQAITARGGGL
jgi:crotonobetainyl-CoA:carnitine CoA-transferase CaiB-like acyl-CoA transferase